MSTFSDFHQAALEDSISVMGEAVVYLGTTYQGIVNKLDKTETLDDGGFMEVYATVIVLLKSDFASAPQVGKTITAMGQRLRIAKVETDTVSYTLGCVADRA